MKHGVKYFAAILISCVTLISLCTVGVSAERISWTSKIPLDTPYFMPEIDGIKDEGYSQGYIVQNRLQSHEIHEGGSELSVAWFGNTLYFHIRVPDTTASETTSSLFYQVDNVWFLLYFDNDSSGSLKWSQDKSVKAFRILPFANVINFKGQCNDTCVFPPKSTDFEWRVLIEENVGYSIEVAYTVPESVATLSNGLECAFDVEVIDVCDKERCVLDYRYILGKSRNEGDLENFPYAYGAKLVLSGGQPAATEDTDQESESSRTDAVSETVIAPEDDSQSVSEDESQSVSVLTVLGIAFCAVSVALIIAAILLKKKTLKTVIAAIAIVFGALAAVMFALPPDREKIPEETSAAAGTDNTETTVSGGEKEVIKHEFFVDRYFSKGMTYTSNKIGGAIIGSFDYGSGSGAWDFGQLGSKYEIVRDGTYTQIADGVHHYEDESKLLYIDTNTGEFKMGIKGSKEYDRPRKGGEVFPGTLLTTQEMSETVFLPDLASVEVTLDFTLDYVTNCMNPREFNDGLHTAQWNYYAFISDSRSNEWFYVGIPLYDYRHEAGNSYGTDPGTGAFCYTPPYFDVFGRDRVKVGERFAHTVDILPFIKDAFVIAQRYGYLEGCKFENMYISGCNYGWELPGTFDCMATSHEFNMTYTLVDELSE